MFAQLFSRAMQHHPKIALGDVQLLADFVVRAVFNLVKLENLGDARGQFAERQFQMFAEFIQLHPAAGQLSFRSTVGVGTVASVRLPLAEANLRDLRAFQGTPHLRPRLQG